MSDFIEYRVGLAARAQHLFDIEARFPTGGRSTLELRLPVWTPGSYLVREYERHVQDLTCTDDAGRPLAVRKVHKARWQVECGAAQRVVAHYRVYAHEVTVRTSHLDDTHAYWNGATLFLYVDELHGAPARITVSDIPTGWRIATALEPASPDASHVLHCPDHDTLVDSPVEIGAHERLEFSAAGHPHQIAIWGRADFDRTRFVDDVRAIVETQARLFGGLPYPRYTFILHLVPGGYGGLEHRSSSSLLASPFAFASPKKYGDFLELVSHEHFHAWNGKRIRPAALGPFDYQQECHTRSLWVVEGWTSYYDRLLLRRAGRIDGARYREKLGDDLTRLLRIPGRLHHSLEESSWDAWIKLYRPDENAVNSTVSYYLKGSVVALLLDLEIRARTGGQRTLDDAMLALWHDCGSRGAGYEDGALQGIVEEAAGVKLDDFFASAVRGREDPDFDVALAGVGLSLTRRGGRASAERGEQGERDAHDGEPEGAWLGAATRQEGGRLKVNEAIEGGPAQQGHVYPGDEIVAWDGFRVDHDALGERLDAARPGDMVRLTLFRRDELRETHVTLGTRPHDKLEVVLLHGAPEEAKRAYQAWLGEEWKE